MKKILFKPEMIRAILDGKKTQTRRLSIRPRFKVGDIVYVGESYFNLTNRDFEIYKTIYKADTDQVFQDGKLLKGWHSGMFMPEKYARIFLKITGAKKERVGRISLNDAKAEGFTCITAFWDYFFKIGKRELSMDTEVWAYTFEVIKK